MRSWPLVTCRHSYVTAPLISLRHSLNNIYLNTAEPKTPLINPPPNQTLKHTPVKPLEQLDGEIKEFLDKCRPAVQRLVQKAIEVPSLLPSWVEPSAHQELTTRVANLRIPTIAYGQPSLLLHGLGEETDGDQFEHLQKVFTFANHTCVT